ncbi:MULTISPECIES: hypothetical protein [Nostocales]|uniref:Transposase n=2 Tax=Nostocales TaxID=1161 RepID=A0ABW8WVT6_9CYAN|nr:hypothetical protein [Tolypothrix bouteillei]
MSLIWLLIEAIDNFQHEPLVMKKIRQNAAGDTAHISSFSS